MSVPPGSAALPGVSQRGAGQAVTESGRWTDLSGDGRRIQRDLADTIDELLRNNFMTIKFLGRRPDRPVRPPGLRSPGPLNAVFRSKILVCCKDYLFGNYKSSRKSVCKKSVRAAVSFRNYSQNPRIRVCFPISWSWIHFTGLSGLRILPRLRGASFVLPKELNQITAKR